MLKLDNSLKLNDPTCDFIKYYSKVSYSEIQEKYKNAELFVFASSCETFGQILTEAMASGLPIACSNMSAIPEILGDAGVYFKPLYPEDIAKSIEEMILSKDLRKILSEKAYLKAKQFSWKKAADETFSFIEQVALKYKNEKERL